MQVAGKQAKRSENLFFCVILKELFNFVPLNYAGVAQLVEHNLAKVGVAGSSLVSRSELVL